MLGALRGLRRAVLCRWLVRLAYVLPPSLTRPEPRSPVSSAIEHACFAPRDGTGERGSGGAEF